MGSRCPGSMVSMDSSTTCDREDKGGKRRHTVSATQHHPAASMGCEEFKFSIGVLNSPEARDSCLKRESYLKRELFEEREEERRKS